MNNHRLLSINMLIISACVICFEIIATRISSVIFVTDYAFIILSLAILGLGCGGIYSHYRIREIEQSESSRIFAKVLILLILSLLIFILCATELHVTKPFIYFFLLLLPFFFAGIFYSLIFKTFAENISILYAADLSGAAIGSVLSIITLNYFGAVNGVLLLVILAAISLIFLLQHSTGKIKILYSLIAVLALILLIFNGNKNILGNIPIGRFPEKDFYTVYPDPEIKSNIIESRWSVYGRSDLVEYNFQDQVKQMFIDGAAGSPMYRFNGNVKKPGNLLLELLINQSNAIPFLFLDKKEKDNMLIIGPGGGKEVLLGLFQDVIKITGIEINPDFVNLVREHKDFNGGIYNNFPNVKILVAEGRHFIKRSLNKYDLIVMALPSTEQVQNIDAFAANENYLLTVEAVKDYLKILTDEGQLIFTLHNEWELIRLITTSAEAFKQMNVSNTEFLNHIAIIEGSYTPTIVIKKNAFTPEQIVHWQNVLKLIPKDLPSVTYLPHGVHNNNSVITRFILALNQGTSLKSLIEKNSNNLSPCVDDCPYFYKVNKGIPDDYLYLLSGIIIFSSFIIGLPYYSLSKSIGKERNSKQKAFIALIVFICLGLGFMIIEISLFQTLILFLGSPTISLSILLCTLLIGMGIGSYNVQRIYPDNNLKRLILISSVIVIAGIVFYIFCPLILKSFLMYSLIYRVLLSIVMILPFGFLLGILFPTSLLLLKANNMQSLIPWMYGVNGVMSVLGSILAAILSMLYGFTFTFFAGLFFYLVIYILIQSYKKVYEAQ